MHLFFTYQRRFLVARWTQHGWLDVHHPRYITERLADMLPNATLVEAPWGDNEWFERTAERDGHLFKSLPMLLPQLLEFDR